MQNISRIFEVVDEKVPEEAVIFRMIIGKDRKVVEVTRREFQALMAEIKEDEALLRQITDQVMDDMRALAHGGSGMDRAPRPYRERISSMMEWRSPQDRDVFLSFFMPTIESEIYLDSARGRPSSNLLIPEVKYFSFKGV